jgi:phenylpropionate dioxygenase-like ring-hydroxylating dioxygenase large terminal subunit
MTVAITNEEEIGPPASLVRPATYLKMDRRAVPPSLFEESTHDLGSAVMGKASITSPEFHQKEVTYLWLKSWQMACRENDIPKVGDRIAYDIVGQSVMLVRVAPGVIKAYHNACQHRGTRLLERCDNVRQISCPFHNWSWNLDGSLKNVPARWDFPGVSDAALALREVRCEIWNSFVFINFDVEAEPLQQFLGPTLLRHWEAWPRGKERKVYHFGKIVPCNWKLALHAFNEVYHTVAVHPQSLNFAADCNAQYDFYGPHTRFILSLGAPSGFVADTADAQDTVDTFFSCYAPHVYPDGPPKVGTGRFDQARALLSDYMRDTLRQITGVDLSDKSDAEMLDGIGYLFFPNMIHWGGYALPVIHRFRPNGHDHRSCLWEIMALAAQPEGAALERDVQLTLLPTDRKFADVPELGFIGHVLDQDVHALTLAQQGAESLGFDGPRFANYQERNLRNFEQHVARLIGET